MRLVFLAAAACLAAPAAAADFVGPPRPPGSFPRSEPRPDKEAKGVKGYYLRKMSGFPVLVSRMAYDQSDEAGGRPLGMVEAELAAVADALPRKTLANLQKLTIWVEWDHAAGGAVPPAVYYRGSPEDLAAEGVDPRKSRAPAYTSLKAAHQQRAAGLDTNFALQVLAFAVLDQVLGYDNAAVKNAHEQAVVKKVIPARQTAAAYFAGLSVAYLGPDGSRAALKKRDSTGYELMTRVWGTPEEIEEGKKAPPPKKK